jgi:hypothetical protein
MPIQAPARFDETRLLTIELGAAPLAEIELGERAGADPGVRGYLEALPPRTALELVRQVRELRALLADAVSALDAAGFTLEAYYALDEAERESPGWLAFRRVREASGAWPEYVMRYTRGSQEHSQSFPTREAALDGAIEVIEMRAGYPRVIETEGRPLMDCNDILHVWEDRHDPG